MGPLIEGTIITPPPPPHRRSIWGPSVLFGGKVEKSVPHAFLALLAKSRFFGVFLQTWGGCTPPLSAGGSAKSKPGFDFVEKKVTGRLSAAVEACPRQAAWRYCVALCRDRSITKEKPRSRSSVAPKRTTAILHSSGLPAPQYARSATFQFRPAKHWRIGNVSSVRHSTAGRTAVGCTLRDTTYRPYMGIMGLYLRLIRREALSLLRLPTSAYGRGVGWQGDSSGKYYSLLSAPTGGSVGGQVTCPLT